MGTADAPSGGFGGLRVALACNLKTERATDSQAEFDEPETIEAILRALRSGGCEPFVLDASDDFPRRLRQTAPDIVFNIAEGVSGRGREAQIPAILDYYGVPYTGSDAAALSVALDKALTKRIAAGAGIATPEFRLIEPGSADFGGMVFPVLLKPNAEGSSKGISDVCVAESPARLKELAAAAQPGEGGLIAERYIDGREFTVGLLGNGGQLRVFEPMEIIYRKLRGGYRVYSYEVKRSYRDYISYKCPPELPDEALRRLKDDAAAIYRLLGCRDFARVDFRMSAEGKIYFIEINPLPGLAPGYSDYPMLAEFCGTDYDSLVCGVLGSALRRCAVRT
jgi:D-alanine-D-alanine ligase